MRTIGQVECKWVVKSVQLRIRSKASPETGIENLKGRPLALAHFGQSRMTLLETTIVEQARPELQNLRCALLLPEGPDRTLDISSSFWMLNGLTMLTTLANSGLGESAAEELHAIDGRWSGDRRREPRRPDQEGHTELMVRCAPAALGEREGLTRAS